MTDSKGRLVAREPLCLFLVTSASWRLRGVKRPPNKEATESSHREPWPANAGALSVRGNEAKPRVICQTRTPPEHGKWAGSREPSWRGRYEGLCYEGSASQTNGRAKSSSRNVRHTNLWRQLVRQFWPFAFDHGPHLVRDMVDAFNIEHVLVEAL